jgi:predicted alpha/beta superfamily hydrolase
LLRLEPKPATLHPIIDPGCGTNPMRVNRLFAFLLALCCLLPTLAGAEPALLEPKPDAVESRVLQQKRQIEVYLPSESAKDPGGRYETLYVLDGDWNTRLVVQIVEFMRQVGVMPPVIVVSVPNFFDEHGVNSRDHDFTPTVAPEQATSGGAADFLAFLETELLPYVDAHYPANHVHLVHGHSYGGLFLVYALLHEPGLFDGYVVLDPALRWDNHALDAALREQLPATPTKGKAIYVAGREGPAFEDMGIASAKDIFESRAPHDLHWSIVAYPAESHDSLKLKATYDALRFMYRGYTSQPIRLVPTGGILLPGKPMFVVADGGGAEFDLHYSTDGSTPTEASPKAEGPFAVSDPERTKVTLLSNRGVFDRALPLALKSGKAIAPPRAARAAATWTLEYHEADAWPRLHGKAFKSAVVDKTLDFDAAGREAFAGRLSGSIDVPADGYYVLAVFTDKANLALSGKPLFEHDSASDGAPYAGFVVPLQRGVYPVRVDFLHPQRTTGFDFTVFQAKDGEPQWWKNKLVELRSDPRH